MNANTTKLLTYAGLAVAGAALVVWTADNLSGDAATVLNAEGNAAQKTTPLVWSIAGLGGLGLLAFLLI